MATEQEIDNLVPMIGPKGSLYGYLIVDGRTWPLRQYGREVKTGMRVETKWKEMTIAAIQEGPDGPKVLVKKLTLTSPREDPFYFEDPFESRSRYAISKLQRHVVGEAEEEPDDDSDPDGPDDPWDFEEHSSAW